MSAEPTLSRRIIRQVRALAREPLPAEVENAARLHLLDALGVGLAAVGSPVGEPYRRFAAGLGAGPATILGLPARVATADAALVNGGLIHSLEYDDTHTPSIVHGSAVVAAAALAAGEAGGASGRAVLAAYALGWEVLVRIGLAAPGAFQARGFQVTSVGGALVSALLAAELWDLDEDAAVASIGIALSTASGVFEFLSNGSSVKSLHPGWAAQGGIRAAELARAGLAGPETAIEGRFGLFRAFTGDDAAAGRLEGLLDDLGTNWTLPQAAYKFQPCCHYLHPFIEAAGRLAEEGVRPDAVAGILCRIAGGAAPIVCEPWEAKQAASGHPARWSLPVVVAARLCDGPVGLATFERPASEATRALAARIAWEPMAGAHFPQAFEAEIVCRLKDGTEGVVRVDDAFGNASRPARPADVRAKFRRNAARALPDATVAALEEAVDALPAAPDLDPLATALRGAAADSRPKRLPA